MFLLVKRASLHIPTGKVTMFFEMTTILPSFFNRLTKKSEATSPLEATSLRIGAT